MWSRTAQTACGAPVWGLHAAEHRAKHKLESLIMSGQ